MYVWLCLRTDWSWLACEYPEQLKTCGGSPTLVKSSSSPNTYGEKKNIAFFIHYYIITVASIITEAVLVINALCYVLGLHLFKLQTWCWQTWGGRLQQRCALSAMPPSSMKRCVMLTPLRCFCKQLPLASYVNSLFLCQDSCLLTYTLSFLIF